MEYKHANPMDTGEGKKHKAPISREALTMLFRIREEIDSFIEEMEIMNDPKLVKEIEEGLKDIEEGNVTEIESVKELDQFFGA